MTRVHEAVPSKHAFWTEGGPDYTDPKYLTDWTKWGAQFAGIMNNMRKYVASRTLRAPLEWENSSLLQGEAPDAVAELKKEPGRDLFVIGSGDFAQTLMEHDLVDEYRLMIHPIVLGDGKRLFRDGSPLAKLTLVDSKTSTTGVVILMYRSGRSDT